MGERGCEAINMWSNATRAHAIECSGRLKVVADQEISFAPTAMVGSQGGSRLCGVGYETAGREPLVSFRGKLSRRTALQTRSAPHNAPLGIISPYRDLSSLKLAETVMQGQ